MLLRLRMSRFGILPSFHPAFAHLIVPPPTSRLRILLVYRRHVSTFVYYPALLAKGGFAVDILTVPGHPVRRSRHVAQCFTAPDRDDAFRDALGERVRLGAPSPAGTSVPYTYLLFVDEPARRLAYGLPSDPILDALLPIPRTHPLAAAVGDKIRFHAWCEAHAFPVARTRLPSDADAAARHAIELGYPVVLKGAVGSGGQAVRICKDEPALQSAFVALARGGAVLVQEFVQGPVGSVAFVARQGRIGAWSASEKFLTLKAGLGPSVVCRTRADAALGDLAARIAAAGALTGITGFDWMETSPGRFVVIDPHFGRCTPPAAIAARSGVHFGDALKRLLASDIPVHVQGPDPGLVGKRIALFPQMVELVVQGQLRALLRAAPPWAADVRYFFGPADEWRLTVGLAAHYLAASMRILAGQVLRRVRRPRAPVASPQAQRCARPNSTTTCLDTPP